MSEMREFFKGLSPEDAALAADDLRFYGTAFVHEIDGKKRRLDPCDVMLTKDQIDDALK